MSEYQTHQQEWLAYRERIQKHFKLKDSEVDDYLRNLDPDVLYHAGYNGRINQEKELLRKLGWIV